jgi:flagellar assembly protein FliH
LQKWFPESLAVKDSQPEFTPVYQDEADGEGGARGNFRTDNPDAVRNSLLDSLNEQERAEVYALVEADVRTTYEKKYQETTQLQQQQWQEWMQSFRDTVSAEVQQKLQFLARETTTLAIAIAEKVIRREVKTDPEIVVRALQTLLYKLEAGAPLTITVHPDDAAYLTDQSELRSRLHIERIKEDRRLDRGGCQVSVARQEWDATVQSQLEALLEIIEENLAGELPLAETDGEDDAGLD